MEQLLLILLFSTMLCICHCKQFQFNSNGNFTILQLTDTHLCGDGDDDITLGVIKNITEASQPDLIILTGDIFSGGCNRPSEWQVQEWKKLTQVFADLNVNYAITLGNHDRDGEMTAQEIMALDMTHPLSVSNTSNFSNPATYTIPIFSHLKEGEVSANLWILDSGAYSCRGDGNSYGCIEDEEVAWYNQESAKFKQQYGTRAHHLAFFHIPIPEYMNLYNNGEVYGHKGEPVCCPLHNTGFFEAVKKNGDITVMFCGHDHVNNYGGWYEGIELVYGRKTGKGLL